MLWDSYDGLSVKRNPSTDLPCRNALTDFAFAQTILRLGLRLWRGDCRVGKAKRDHRTRVRWARRAKSAPLPTLHSRLLRDRHRNAGDLQIYRAQHSAAREEQGLPVAAAE